MNISEQLGVQWSICSVVGGQLDHEFVLGGGSAFAYINSGDVGFTSGVCV